MHKDMLGSFLHLYYCFATRRGALIQLLELFANNPRSLIESSDLDLRAAGLSKAIIQNIRKPDQAKIEADLAWCKTPGNHLVCFDDDHYPALLRQIDDCPAMLYATGNLELLPTPQLAIVGSRNCTHAAARLAYEFSAELSELGITITSGMATGIDTQAHLGALDKSGNTIAVIGTGIDRIYPAGNKKLAQSITKQGLLISEFPLGTRALPAHFPQRNRIISGLSMGTLVVEAAKRSGSLITARLAAEQGREVFALPGSIHNPQVRGCHRLIRDGAKLVEQISDITEELTSLYGFVNPAANEPVAESKISLDIEYECLLKVIDYEPVHLDTLLQRSCLTIDKLSSMLLVLELQDLIQSVPGGCYVRI
ncbi:MAG: DNA processing protein [Planctomycetota bacterium]|jgi:DNA processing protein